jgi:teichuronic acid biosynthesis glycosyltransferase TuaC
MSTAARSPTDTARTGAESMHVVIIGSAFPRHPEAGVDRVNVRRVRALAARAPVVAVVPTPWVPPGLRARDERWGGYATTPRHVEIDGVQLFYPRYVQVPGMGPWAGVTMAVGTAGIIRRLRRAGRCDLLLAQDILPEGLAAVLLGRWIGVPAACLGRGTDVHGLTHAPSTTRGIVRWTLGRMAAIGVVAAALGETLNRVAGTAACTLLEDGIDLEHFAPGSARHARRALGIDEDTRVVLYAGRLVEGKGLDTLLDAFGLLRATVPNAMLALVGSGRLQTALECRAVAQGQGAAVRVVGEVAHRRIAEWMRAAEVVVLPSEAEGFPNVVREALACGRPVVATPVGDVPRVLTADAGRLVPPRDPAALAHAIADVLARRWDAATIRAHVSDMTWERSAETTARFLTAALSAASAANRRRSVAPEAPVA